MEKLRPILCRLGGKKLLVKRILREIPPHETYVEPFMGGGTVFFAKDLAKKNVLGDNDRELMSFYKQVKKKGKLTCDLRENRGAWERAKNKVGKTPCEYARVVLGSFGCGGKHYDKKQDRHVHRVVSFDDQAKKLQKTVLNDGDFRNLIKKHDSKHTFFYLDPPYHKLSCSYPQGSCSVTPKDLAQALKGVKGKFLLSYNDHPEIRTQFCKKYRCKTVDTKYSANKNSNPNQQKRKELFIKNFHGGSK